MTFSVHPSKMSANMSESKFLIFFIAYADSLAINIIQQCWMARGLQRQIHATPTRHGLRHKRSCCAKPSTLPPVCDVRALSLRTRCGRSRCVKSSCCSRCLSFRALRHIQTSIASFWATTAWSSNGRRASEVAYRQPLLGVGVCGNSLTLLAMRGAVHTPQLYLVVAIKNVGETKETQNFGTNIRKTYIICFVFVGK